MDAALELAALPLAEAASAGEARVGGKAAGLARLAALGLPVPPAVVLPVCFRPSADALAAAAAGLRPPLAVRSSAVGEDSAERSAAGQYLTVLGVRDAAGLADAVERCLASARSERAAAYRGEPDASMALVVQEQLPAGRSGVAFSIDPLSGAREEVLIEAVFGLGEGIVSGAVTPDRFRVGADGRVRARRARKEALVDAAGRRRRLSAERALARTLRDDEARALAALVRRAEAGFGAPVDVEFCFVGPAPWLLQCRPVTALSTA